MSEDCLLGIRSVEGYGHRFLGRVQVKGGAEALAVYEFYDGDPPEIVALKEQTRVHFAEALEDYFARRFPEAAVSLKKVLRPTRATRRPSVTSRTRPTTGWTASTTSGRASRR